MILSCWRPGTCSQGVLLPDGKTWKHWGWTSRAWRNADASKINFSVVFVFPASAFSLPPSGRHFFSGTFPESLSPTPSLSTNRCPNIPHPFQILTAIRRKGWKCPTYFRVRLECLLCILTIPPSVNDKSKKSQCTHNSKLL